LSSFATSDDAHGLVCDRSSPPGPAVFAVVWTGHGPGRVVAGLPSWLLGAMLRDRARRSVGPLPAAEAGMQADDDQAVARAEESRRHASSARERARLAKRRELAAHDRAIELHERAAELQERLGHPDRAAAAREHARHARRQLALALREQQGQEGETPAGGHQMAVAL
jgi:hypothetical protein